MIAHPLLYHHAHHALTVPGTDALLPTHHHSQPSDSIVIRQATLLDLDAMVSIALAAMPLDPQWDYRFPHRRVFPTDTRDFTRRRYRDFLENKSGRWSVALAELVNPRASSSGTPQADHLNNRPQTIAFAVWDVAHVTARFQPTHQHTQLHNGHRLIQVTPPREPTPPPDPATCCRRDANAKRLQAWSQTLAASRKLFDQQFGDNHFQLQILACHPKFQRSGAGTALCGAGIEAAEILNMQISVFASPMGKRLYSRLGFRQLATVTVKVEGEEESVSVAAMVYQTGGQQP